MMARRVADLVAAAWNLPPASPDIGSPTDEIAVEVPLTSFSPVYGGAVSIDGGRLKVSTIPQSGGYSAIAPLELSPQASDPIVLDMSVRVLKGKAAVALLDPSHSGTRIVAEKLVDPSHGRTHVELPMPARGEATQIVVRTAGGYALASEVVIDSVIVRYRAAADTTRTH